MGPVAPNLILRKFRKASQEVRRLARHAKADRMSFASGLGESSYILYGLTRSMKPEVCVEIGSARGRSACFIGMALNENGLGKLFAIDPHTQTSWNDNESVHTYDIMRQNLVRLGVAEQVEILRQTSEQAAKSWSRPIDLLFIDGDHSYEGVKRDWDLFVPHVRDFGIVIFHDTLWELKPDPSWSRADMGVPRFVEELRQQGFPVVTLDRDRGVSLVQPRKGGHLLSPDAISQTRSMRIAD